MVTLAGALLFLAADSARKLSTLRTITSLGETGRSAPAFDAASPTGYQDGRRNLIVESTDGYHWVMQTQQMIATGEWRLRHVDYDNAPGGRDVHWCSPMHWWLAGVAWIDHAVTGRPWLVSVESAARYAGPWLLGLLLVTLVPWAARRFGSWPASLLAAGFVAIAPLSGEFGTGSYDHHGAAAACALLAVLCLLAGWTASTPAQARRDFIASGVAGAAGLWINAATLVPVLAGIGAGAWLAQRLVRQEKVAPDPGLWRVWGVAGGLASLGFYLVEYFPSHLGWHLEVNHPLYALAWAGAGDLLARLGERRYAHAAIASGVAVIAPAAVMFLAPAQTFALADKFLWTLHVDYISEFAPLAAALSGWVASLVVLNLLLGLGWVAVWLWRGRLTPQQRALLALAWVPAVLITLLAVSQQRWLHVLAALWLGVLVAAAFITTTGGFTWNGPRRALAGLFLAAVFLPYPLRAGLDVLGGPAGLSRENIRQFAVRDLAYWLRRHTGGDAVTVLSGPTATSELVYHGGFRGIGTLYWENHAGLRTLVDIYGAPNADEARHRAQAAGVTHIVMLPWGSFADEAARLARGLRAGEPLPPGGFARDLLESGRGLPDWLRPLPYHLPQAEAFKDQFALVLEVAPQQSPTDAAVGRAQFFAAMGNPADARSLINQVLADQPDHLMALVTLARFQRADRDRTGHGATMRRVQSLLASDQPLPPRDRIALAVELAASGSPAAARFQTVRVWESVDEAGVRRLPPESLPMLLRLTRDLSVSAPPALLGLAETLAASDGGRPAG